MRNRITTYHYIDFQTGLNLGGRFFDRQGYMSVLIRLFPKFELWVDMRKNIITGDLRMFDFKRNRSAYRKPFLTFGGK